MPAAAAPIWQTRLTPPGVAKAGADCGGTGGQRGGSQPGWVVPWHQGRQR